MKRYFTLLTLCFLYTLSTAQILQDSKVEPSVDPPLPCQFSWAAVVPLGGGTPLDFTEDDYGCQPYQGPCVAFSFVKAMETQLNINHNSACEIYDYSIAFLDYAAYFNPDAYMNVLNEGLGIPEEGCGDFPPDCLDYGQNSTCHCIPNMIQTQATDNDLCFEVSSIPQEPSDELDCDEIWQVNTSPITGTRLHATSVNKPTINNIFQLKNTIINNGPVVAVLEASILNEFRDYDVPVPFSFHSFNIIGWEDVNGDYTKWKIDDHWPGEGGAFCGLGETHTISNDDLISYFQDGSLYIYVINDVYVEEPDGESGCQDANAISFNYNDQNDCEPSFECPSLMITDIVFNGQGNCMRTEGTNPFTAWVNICNNTQNYEYEWIIESGGVGQPSPFNCGSNNLILYFGDDETVTIKVRVRYSSLCEWSPWREENFCVKQGSDGNGGGPYINIPIRY